MAIRAYNINAPTTFAPAAGVVVTGGPEGGRSYQTPATGIQLTVNQVYSITIVPPAGWEFVQWGRDPTTGGPTGGTNPTRTAAPTSAGVATLPIDPLTGRPVLSFNAYLRQLVTAVATANPAFEGVSTMGGTSGFR